MLYLLDANTLIHAKSQYYPLHMVPEFWDWLVYLGQKGAIKIPIEIYEEFKDTNPRDDVKDELAVWAEKDEVKNALLFDEQAEPDLVSRVIYEGYTRNPSDDDISKIGRDPFLISYAIRDNERRCIVTEEASKPSKQGANRKIPDVCKGFGVKCVCTFDLIRMLNFSTSWRLNI